MLSEAQCGTSWEGARWVAKGDPASERFAWVLDTRLGSIVLWLAVLAFAALTVLLYASPAYAHSGVSCYADAWKPVRVQGGIAAKSVFGCSRYGYWHNFRTEIWKNINNWPDAAVGYREVAGPDSARFALWSSGGMRGCGTYYSIGRVKWHDYDRSNRNYYGC